MTYFCDEVLAGYATAPQFTPKNLYDLPLTPIAKGCANGKGENNADPVEDALRFYTLNHLAMILRKEFTPHQKLPDWARAIMRDYLECVASQGSRMFKYVLLIITRESRHIHNKEHSFWGPFVEKYGAELKAFNEAIRNKGTDGTANYLIDNPPAALVGAHVEAIEYIFREGKFSGGYGGLPWAEIAKTLLMLLKGELTMETFLDTAYTLAHNGGPIFNKGMFYDHYDGVIFKVLDVQRSGQMPQYVLEYHEHDGDLHDVLKHVKNLREAFPDALGHYVDWFQVEALGSKNKYPGEKKKQQALHGGGEVTKNGDKIIGQWQVYPGQSINVIERKKIKKVA